MLQYTYNMLIKHHYLLLSFNKIVLMCCVHILTDKSQDDVGQRNASRTHNSKSQSQMLYNLRKRKRNEEWGELYIMCIHFIGGHYLYVLCLYCFGDQYIGGQWFYELISWDDRINISYEIIEYWWNHINSYLTMILQFWVPQMIK